MVEFATTKVRVTGRVQGVGFRAWTEREARRLGLTGWVRNEPDGAVTAFLAGRPEAVATMLERLHRGPLGASVADVTMLPSDGEAIPSDFRVTR
ncbi:acylphosphatase [Neorhizobium alkalisoli]|uniref:Acylphosphatase n=1 Tax=Neorhizobium alkalisoli TaxID=528178 RepID=A0A561R347_9HYPH|nr:acylphosphatase [Neorhizobium alkalisoli]TWF57045.1 acylphosphatase [Neorhizobium alkalisoli]